MTTKKRRFLRRGFLLVLGVGLAAAAWHVVARWLELRDYAGGWREWAVRTTPSGALLPWKTEVALWKSRSGGWAGTFLYRDGWREDRLCVGRLVQQSSGDDGVVFREEGSNCPAGRLRVRRAGSGKLAVWRSGGGQEGPGSFDAVLAGYGKEILADTATWRAHRRPRQVIRPGQTIRGALAAGDPVSYTYGEFDTFLYAGDPGMPIVVRVKSDSLLPLVVWGAVIGDQWIDGEGGETEQAEGGELRVPVMPRGPGDYGFHLVTAGGRHGGYTLTVEPGRQPERTIRWLPRLEREGEVSGRLEARDSALAPPVGYRVGTVFVDSMSYDTYAFFAVAGERIDITMRAAELAPVMWIGVVQEGEFVPLTSSITTRAGEAVLQFVPPAPGDYVVRVGSFAPKEGTYTIRTKDSFPDAAPSR
jgi:hypothetical protein